MPAFSSTGGQFSVHSKMKRVRATHRHTMKRNIFYLLCGFFGLILVSLFYISMELRMPWIVCAAFVIAAVLVFFMHRRISDRIVDERQILIDMKSSSATLKAGTVLLIAGNLAVAVYAFSMPPMFFGPMPHFQPPSTIPLTQLGQFALVEMALLAVVVFIYVGFRVYYTKKYGVSDDEDGDDEE